MMASSSAMTTRTANGDSLPPALLSALLPLTGLDDQPIEQLVLRSLELGNGVLQRRPAPGHGVGVPLCLLVFLVGQRRLRDQGSKAGVVGRIGEDSQLLVDDGQFFTGATKAVMHVAKATLDH